ncbi:hypothetical protein [Arsenicibacter rosenii]|nr:hypothetical protein [Arsenicibacter rosenii]
MPPSSLPNPAGEYVEAIQSYVEKVGIGRFAYVPGYQNSKKSQRPTLP